MFGLVRDAVTELTCHLLRDDMQTDTAILARIQSETSHRLDVLARCVAEGRDVMAASEFCRWLSFSGILILLERYPNQVPSHNPLKVDGAFLRWKCEDLQSAVNERLRTGNEIHCLKKASFSPCTKKLIGWPAISRG